MSSYLPSLPAPKYQSPLARTCARKSLSMGEMRRPTSLSAESIKAVAQLHEEVLFHETQDQQFIQSVPPHFPASPPPPSMSGADSDIASTRSGVPSTRSAASKLGALASPEPPVMTVRSTPTLPMAMAFYPNTIITRVYLVPHIAMSQDDEDTLRIETRYGWESRCHEHLSRREQNPAYIVAKEPVIVWLNAKENIFELRSRPWRLLGPGDEIECFGLLVGTWRLTEKRERCTTWGTKKHHRHEEWVYTLTENVETEEETYLKMPARHYDPPSFTMRITASWRKLGSLVTKRSV
ncbi:hypothetical protein C8F04DRAFT_1268545 [Mycena alexandri]|uniref:Uncharacterized protein n=1 Tax=Mycena alexandri TaxID=1745969 RepID=A0AAD6SDQ1_9AGAR|nr:hypothetical protein C8F04DRAFT_1268545 [Mycena alexandri]